MSLVTPDKLEKIPRDDSFKTCESTMATPRTRHNLRQTAARTSILSGGTPYKESPCLTGKKNRSRRKMLAVQENLTTDSNETFIRCEQELLFDRDSLEIGTSHPIRFSSTPRTSDRFNPPIEPIAATEPIEKMADIKASPVNETQVITKSVEKVEKKNTVQEKREGFKKPQVAKESETFKKPEVFKKPEAFKKPQAPIPKRTPRNIPNQRVVDRSSQKTKQEPKNNDQNTFITPRVGMRRAAEMTSTASSRYLSSSKLNSSRLSRALSFKSTAELERDYFSSLRSF